MARPFLATPPEARRPPKRTAIPKTRSAASNPARLHQLLFPMLNLRKVDLEQDIMLID